MVSVSHRSTHISRMMQHFHSIFFYAHVKWKARTNVTPGRQPDQGTRPRGVSEPNVWLYSLFLDYHKRTRCLRRCSMRQPTVYSYTSSHRSPCIRVDSPTQFHFHQHHDHYHPDSQFNNIITM